jgi:hypothetical protein
MQDKEAMKLLEAYLSRAQDKLHCAIGLCVDKKIKGFDDIKLLIGEIQQMKNRAAEAPDGQ